MSQMDMSPVILTNLIHHSNVFLLGSGSINPRVVFAGKLVVTDQQELAGTLVDIAVRKQFRIATYHKHIWTLVASTHESQEIYKVSSSQKCSLLSKKF